MNQFLKYTLFTFAVMVFAFTAFTNKALAAPVTINCSGTSGSPTAVTESAINGTDDVTFVDAGGDGYCVLDEPISCASVVVGDGAGGNVVLTHTAADADGVTITTTGNFTINSGSSINVDSKGCVDSTGDAHGYGPNDSNACTYNGYGAGQGGTAAYQGGGGAGYGGYGGAGKTGLAGGSYFTSSSDTNYSNPTLLGASGGTTESGAGGSGGGLVFLNIGGTLTHAGTIVANGGAGVTYGSGGASGGGSGGAINITAQKVSGAGTFSATGGNGANNGSADGGGGAGGRIVIKYTDDTTKTFTSVDFSVSGGLGPDEAVDGGYGSVHVEDTDANDVIIFYGYIYNRDISVGSWTVDASAVGQLCDGTTDATPSITTTRALYLSGTFVCTHASVTGFDTAVGTSATISGLTFTMNGVDSTRTINTWSMDDAVSLVVTSSTINSNINWTNLTSLSFDASTTINASSKGCQDITGDSNGYGPNASNVCSYGGSGAGAGSTSAWTGGGGGGHGGAGGNGQAGLAGGSTFDTLNSPTLLGASGGTSGTKVGGVGGGLVIIGINGDFQHNGAILADGGAGGIAGGGEASGGGSGGSISVSVNGIFSGTTGSFSADGGAGGNNSGADGGGGGGGRIYIGYGTDSSSYLNGLAAATVTVGGSGPDSATDGAVGTLSKIQVTVINSIVITDTSGYTNDATPVITISQSGATPTHVAFSCDNSNWSSWLAYPDDEVVNDGDGPSFDLAIDATNCSSANELKTIYAKIKDGSSESSVVSDTTTFDTNSPTVSYVTASNDNGTYGASVVLGIQVVFNEIITVGGGGTPTIELDFDGTDRSATYASGTGTTTLLFNYTTVNGDNKTDLDYATINALANNGANMTDLAGNVAGLALPAVGEANSLAGRKDINVSTNQSPTVASVTASQATDGSGAVTITFIMDDPDDDDTLQALVEYDIGGGWTKATLSEEDATASATYGDPNVENDNTYQVGNASAYITSSSGANTVSVVWNSASDESAANLSSAQVRITPYDGTATGSTASKTSITLDNVVPASLASFARSSATTTTATFTWTAATDTNFNHYEIWIDQTQSDAQTRTSATEWDNSDDANLTTATTATTTITGLTKQTTYYAKIWAVDDFGNETTLSDISFTTGSSGTSTPAVSSPAISSGAEGTVQEVATNIASSTCDSGVTSGSKVKLVWIATSSVHLVNIYYSTDLGANYIKIAGPIANSESYSWTIPAGLADGSQIQFKIEGTDLAIITSSFETSPINVCASSVTVPDQEETQDADNLTDSQDQADESSVPDTVVPIGMAIESTLGQKWEKDAAKRNVDTTTFPTGEVAIGSLVKLPDDGDPTTQVDSAVYYVGSDHRRHPFPNESVYKAWFTTFYGIKTIDADTMLSIPMGPMVTYRPGSTLVKFPSVNKVYVVDSDGSLRWIASEELAQALYGDEWSKFVVDISEAFWSSYTFGSNLTSMSDMTWDSVMAVYGK